MAVHAPTIPHKMPDGKPPVAACELQGRIVTRPCLTPRLHTLEDSRRALQPHRARLGTLCPRLPDTLVEDDVTLPNVSNMVYRVHLNVKFDMRRVYLAFGHAEYHPAKFAAIAITDDSVTCSFFRPGKMVVTSSKTIMMARANAHRYRILVEDIAQPAIMIRPPAALGGGAGEGKGGGAGGGGTEVSNATLYKAGRAQLRSQLPHFTRFGLCSTRPYTYFDLAGAVNVVADGDLGTFPLSLAGIYVDYRRYVTWNPAKFPGLVFPITSKFIFSHPELARTISKPCTVIIFHTGKDNIMGAGSLQDAYAVHRFLAKIVRKYQAHDFPANKAEIYDYSCEQHRIVTERMAKRFRKRQRAYSGAPAANAREEMLPPARKKPRITHTLSAHHRTALTSLLSS